jgi:hypothetical protein
MENTTKYKSLIGKNIVASGWHYDNGGAMEGVILDITKYEVFEQWNVFVDENTEGEQKNFTFTTKQMDTLLADKELPKANPLLNTGTNAKIL